MASPRCRRSSGSCSNTMRSRRRSVTKNYCECANEASAVVRLRRSHLHLIFLFFLSIIFFSIIFFFLFFLSSRALHGRLDQPELNASASRSPLAVGDVFFHFRIVTHCVDELLITFLEKASAAAAASTLAHAASSGLWGVSAVLPASIGK